MNVIVVGCGRVGSQLATLLSRNGHNVCVIDRQEKSFISLGNDFSGTTIKGNGHDEETLQKAGIDECDAFAAVTNIDNANLMAAEVARKIHNVKHVFTRLFNPERESAYMYLGIDYACGTSLVAEELFSKIQSGQANHIETFGDYEIMSCVLRTRNGQARVQDIERTREVRVVAYERAGVSAIPQSETILKNGDIIIACVKISIMDDFNRFVNSR